ncbi:MAG: penicillin-binding protein [Deltaproteobacteria bacterium]|nr:penicillin-binding protein [Deltaproteobacteria bacterium]
MKRPGRIVSLSLGIAFSLALCAVIAGTFGISRSMRELKIPAFHDIRNSYKVSDAVLFDRNKEIIHTLRTDNSGRRLEWACLSDVSPSFLQTVILGEDRRFYSHHGVDFQAFTAAFIGNIFSQKLRGASTISMQVASVFTTDLKPGRGRRNLRQKWRQVLTALALEKTWTKQEILEAYINFVYYRGELQGIRAASKGLFGKEPSGITRSESLILASLITSPNAPREAVASRSIRLGRKTGTEVDRDDIDRKSREALASAYHIGFDVSIAPHVARTLLTPGRDKIVSTLDGRIQRFALESVKNNLAALRNRKVSDGAVLVVDNVTGEILAYIGNSAETSSAVWIDGIRARRQAGSTLKPFLYELAIEKGYMTPASLLEDTPVAITTPTGLYVPQNYDNQFRGTVSARTALASSLNVPAVKALLVAGLSPFVERLRSIGFNSITEEPEFYGYSIALGSADVELYELVNAYRCLARGGLRSGMKLTFDNRSPAKERVMDDKASFIVSQILSDRESRAMTFGLENPLSTRFWTAVKTGTSKDMRDNWCIGFSSRYTVGVWVGNFSGEPMRDVSGISGAAPIWLEIMNFLHASSPSHAPKAPDGIVTAHIAFEKNIEPSREELFLAGTEPLARVKANTVYEEARIVYPQEGTLITIDPDIPASLQRVGLRFEPGGKRFRWMINGRDAGSDGPLLLWEPRPGTYTVSIVDQGGKVMDSVGFIVR